MPERKEELKLFHVHQDCIQCANGEMMVVKHPSEIHKSPESYEHRCTVCDHAEWHPVQYPYYRFEDRGGKNAGGNAKGARHFDSPRDKKGR